MQDKLYGVYPIVSNKTIRTNEKLFIRWKNRHKDIPGKQMVKTNRGWFLDGVNIDEKSVETWFQLTGNDRNWRPKK